MTNSKLSRAIIYPKIVDTPNRKFDLFITCFVVMNNLINIDKYYIILKNYLVKVINISSRKIDIFKAFFTIVFDGSHLMTRKLVWIFVPLPQVQIIYC